MTLNATPLQMGFLGTVQYIPWLLVGLIAGAWADRLRRRPIMVAADLGRTLLLGFIPLAAVAGILRMEHLYVVGFLVGIMNVFFDVAYAAYLPTLVPCDRLVEGNSKLQMSAAIVEIGGPGLAGGLIQLMTAPLAIVVDTLSFLVSALFLTLIGAPEPKPTLGNDAHSLLVEIREGLRLVLSNPILRSFALASVTTNFFVDVHLAVFVLYVTRELEVLPIILGSIYAIASIGGLLGSLFAERLVKWMGLGRIIVGMQILVTLALLAIPFSGRQSRIAVPLIIIAEALWGFAAVVYVVNTASLRQAITPNEFQGRVMASLRFVTWGIAPLGFLLGGILGEAIGLQATLLVAVAGPLLSVVCLVLSPVPRLHEPPVSESLIAPITTVT
jgi:MFS family permease